MVKSKGLHISDDLTLPQDAVTSTMVVYGGKGMGKTNLGAVLVEELSAAGLRWAVLDPMGVWWGMRHTADGKGNGVECLILGGAHGDIPIEPTGGAVVADLVADELVNVIVDISRKVNGEMWSIGERIRFAHDYGKQLFRRQGSLVGGTRREPICQVIDEAARFVPQMIRGGQPEVALCAGTWSAIVEEGRNVGLGVVLLTQRSARLNKDVAELADVMLAFRTVGPNSIEAVMDWLGANVPKTELKAMSETVRSLPVGSCVAVSPGWLKLEKVIRIRKRHTFDSSATPKPGLRAAQVKGNGAKPDLGVYAERMKETIERAKGDDPKALKARIRELEKKTAEYKPVAVAKHVVDPTLVKENAELKKRLVDVGQKAKKLHTYVDSQIWPMLEKLKSGLVDIDVAMGVIRSAADKNVPIEPQRPVAPMRPTPTTRIPLVTVDVTDHGLSRDRSSKLTGTALKVAGIVAGYAKRGEGIDKKLLATLCGNTMGGSFSARISEARTAGAITTDGSKVYATPEGIAEYADAFHAPETTDEVLALWRPKLSGVALQIFDHLVSLGGEWISRGDLAEAVGATMGGSFSARLSEARSTQLLVENGGKVAVNCELLFL